MSDTKRAAIVGTAESWIEAPWDDPGITIVTLNDGYQLGTPRSDEHYDIHPFGRMWFRPKHKRVFQQGEIPEDVYVRPEGHLEWLKEKAKTIPVWLHDTPPADWPVNAKQFPWKEVMAFMKARPDQDAYMASSPAPMLAHLILRGFTEIQIFGIHLATDHEYRKQRPNLEWLMGRAEAMGIRIVLPPSCPLLKHTHVYAYEDEPKPPSHEAQKRAAHLSKKYQRIVNDLVLLPRWRSKAALNEELLRVRAALRDAKMQARHAEMTAQR